MGMAHFQPWAFGRLNAAWGSWAAPWGCAPRGDAPGARSEKRRRGRRCCSGALLAAPLQIFSPVDEDLESLHRTGDRSPRRRATRRRGAEFSLGERPRRSNSQKSRLGFKGLAGGNSRVGPGTDGGRISGRCAGRSRLRGFGRAPPRLCPVSRPSGKSADGRVPSPRGSLLQPGRYGRAAEFVSPNSGTWTSTPANSSPPLSRTWADDS